MTLGKREKIILAVGVVFVTAVLIIQMAIVPLLKWQQRQVRTYDATVQNLAEMQQLSARFYSMSSQSAKVKQQLANRKQGFTLFSFLDQQAGQAGIKGSIAYMKPISPAGNSTSLQTAAVEMKLVTISMAQLVDFLVRVETSPDVIWVKSLSIKQTGREETYIDVVMMVETLLV